MKLSEVERNYIITLSDGRVGYAGEKEYKAESRPVHFRVCGKTVTEELPVNTEVIISLVPESLIWDHLDREDHDSFKVELDKNRDGILQRDRLLKDLGLTRADSTASRQLEVEQQEYARKFDQIELETKHNRAKEDLGMTMQQVADKVADQYAETYIDQLKKSLETPQD